MASNVVGLFETHAQADSAIRELLAEGIAPSSISILAADPGGTIQRQVVDHSGDMAAAGAATGAASGLVVGSLVGLLIGALTIAAPPAGLLLAGPVAGLLGGAGIGVLSGGLLGAMIGLGVSEPEAEIYAESVRRGGTVLTVEVTELERPRVEAIMSAVGAVSVEERAAMYHREGFVRFDPSLPMYTEAEVAAELARRNAMPITTLTTQDVILPDDNLPVENLAVGSEADLVPVGMDSIFEQHFMTSERDITGLDYTQLRPAYRFGYEIAEQPEYQHRAWQDVQPAAQQTWEDLNPGTWDKVAGAVHFGWSCLASPVALGTKPPIRSGIGQAKVL